MLNTQNILKTMEMIDQQHLDIRTVTMGISLMDCIDADATRCCEKIYDKITSRASGLVRTVEAVQREYGVPIVNKRISVTPVALLTQAAGGDCAAYAVALDRAAKACGVDFIGGFSALVHKGYTEGERRFIESLPEALAQRIWSAPASMWLPLDRASIWTL